MEKKKYYHLVFGKTFCPNKIEFADMLVSVGLYDDSITPVKIAGNINEHCLNNERFKVYESPSKKLSKKSKMIFEGGLIDSLTFNTQKHE